MRLIQWHNLFVMNLKMYPIKYNNLTHKKVCGVIYDIGPPQLSILCVIARIHQYANVITLTSPWTMCKSVRSIHWYDIVIRIQLIVVQENTMKPAQHDDILLPTFCVLLTPVLLMAWLVQEICAAKWKQISETDPLQSRYFCDFFLKN